MIGHGRSRLNLSLHLHLPHLRLAHVLLSHCRRFLVRHILRTTPRVLLDLWGHRTLRTWRRRWWVRPAVIEAARGDGRVAPCRITPLLLLLWPRCVGVAHVWRLDARSLLLLLLVWLLIVPSNHVLGGTRCVPSSA